MTEQPRIDFPAGLGAPAVRALLAAGFSELTQLADVPAAEIERLHGVGPTALARLRVALEREGLSLR